MSLNRADGETINHSLFSHHYLTAKPITKAWELIIRFGIILGFILIVYSSVTGQLFQPLIHSIVNLHWSRLIIRPGILWAFMGMMLLTFRTILWFRYRPFLAVDMAEAPCGLDHDPAIGGPGKGKQLMPRRKRCNLKGNKIKRLIK